jgi:hypothetical protein
MVDLQKFVELANKYAPELEAGLTSWALSARFPAPNTQFFVDYHSEYQHLNGDFMYALLEYLKGQSPRRMNDSVWQALFKALDSKWERLTPEAVIQACIDYWEAME